MKYAVFLIQLLRTDFLEFPAWSGDAVTGADNTGTWGLGGGGLLVGVGLHGRRGTDTAVAVGHAFLVGRRAAADLHRSEGWGGNGVGIYNSLAKIGTMTFMVNGPTLGDMCGITLVVQFRWCRGVHRIADVGNGRSAKRWGRGEGVPRRHGKTFHGIKTSYGSFLRDMVQAGNVCMGGARGINQSACKVLARGHMMADGSIQGEPRQRVPGDSTRDVVSAHLAGAVRRHGGRGVRGKRRRNGTASIRRGSRC